MAVTVQTSVDGHPVVELESFTEADAESARAAGAELICVPTNWPWVDRPEGERAPEVTIAMAAARVNRVSIACCDRTGTERGQQWNAGTSIVDEQGWVLASQIGAGPATATVDLTRSHDKTYTDMADALADRRPELYGAVGQPVARPVA